MDHPSKHDPVDVLIAGAGPVGLFLACELALSGLSVRILDRAKDPHSPLKRLPFGMRGLSIPTLEAFYRRGLLDSLKTQRPRQPGHFAGIPFESCNIDSEKWTYRLPNPADTPLAAEMESIETTLSARAREMGVEILYGREVDDFEASDHEVVVHAGDQSFRARWLVGCDGGRSVVRKVGGFEFPGTAPRFTGYSVQVELSGDETLPIGRHYTPAGMYFHSQPGTIAMADFDGGAFHRSAPVTLEHVQAVLRRVTGIGVTVKACHLATTWTDRAQQAATYRKGRVLLAGDAAHVHSPLGGQGLNLGLGDAMNLGWKLASVVKHRAPDALLDSYSRERHPIGVAVLEWSRAQVAVMEPSAQSRALEGVIRDLIQTRDGATYFAGHIWGVSLRYDLGDSHPLMGRSCPDFELTDGSRLGELLREGIGILLSFDDHPALRSIGRRAGTSLKYVESGAKNPLGLRAVLIRPDGFVAWACDGEPDPTQVIQALSQWLPPQTVAALH